MNALNVSQFKIVIHDKGGTMLRSIIAILLLGASTFSQTSVPLPPGLPASAGVLYNNFLLDFDRDGSKDLVTLYQSPYSLTMSVYSFNKSQILVSDTCNRLPNQTGSISDLISAYEPGSGSGLNENILVFCNKYYVYSHVISKKKVL
jgi:hypothetical protein